MNNKAQNRQILVVRSILLNAEKDWYRSASVYGVQKSEKTWNDCAKDIAKEKDKKTKKTKQNFFLCTMYFLFIGTNLKKDTGLKLFGI